MTASRWRGEELEAMRVAYERMALKIEAIATDFKTSPGTIMRLAKRHCWTRRRFTYVIYRKPI